MAGDKYLVLGVGQGSDAPEEGHGKKALSHKALFDFYSRFGFESILEGENYMIIDLEKVKLAEGGSLKKLASGFYEGEYKGVRFQITKQEENAYGGKPMWYYEIYNEALGYFGRAHDLYFTKSQAVESAKQEIDMKNDKFAEGGKTQIKEANKELLEKVDFDNILPTYTIDDIRGDAFQLDKDDVNEILDKINAPFNVTYELGSGANGTAWETTRGSVLKITLEGDEAYTSYIIFKNQQNFTTQAEIYNLFIVIDLEDAVKYFFIEKQKLEPFTNVGSDELQGNYEAIVRIAESRYYSDDDKEAEFKELIEEQEEYLTEEDVENARAIFELAKKIQKESKAYGVRLTDNHKGNVGYDSSGKLLCYDCAYRGDKTFLVGGKIKNNYMKKDLNLKDSLKSSIPLFFDENIDIPNEFDRGYKKELNNILKSFKIPFKVIKYLGGGASGQAWETDRGTVLKITRNGIEAYSSYIILKNMDDFKSQAKIYNIFILVGEGGDNAFFIEKQKGEVLDDNLKKSSFAHYWHEELIHYGMRQPKKQYDKDFLDELKETYVDRFSNDKVSSNDLKYGQQLIELGRNVKREMEKYDISLHDSHAGNIGYFNGKILCFDCSYGGEHSIKLGRFERGGEISQEEKKETYAKWRKLVNMSRSELERFYNSEEGKVAGLTPQEAEEAGIDSGRESARWIMKMKSTKVADWTPMMWKWAKKQISFISRMSGNKGKLVDENGQKTRKHLSILIWGHNPNKKAMGGDVEEPCHVCSMSEGGYNQLPSLTEMADGKRFIYREDVFRKGGDTNTHVGSRYMILECMGEGGIADTLNLKVIQSSDGLLPNTMITRPIRNIINRGREMGERFGKTIVGSYKKGGELNPDDKKVKNYFEHKSGSAGGLLVGKRHSEGGIKAINNSTGQPLEMEGGEVVITRDAVSDPSLHTFDGKEMTQREILSEINQNGGGVAFADGGETPNKNC